MLTIYALPSPRKPGSTRARTPSPAQAGSFGSLGSMLGDKAAEMSALAQQRFGTGLLGTYGGGLLGSFSGGGGN